MRKPWSAGRPRIKLGEEIAKEEEAEEVEEPEE